MDKWGIGEYEITRTLNQMGIEYVRNSHHPKVNLEPRGNTLVVGILNTQEEIETANTNISLGPQKAWTLFIFILPEIGTLSGM